MKTERSTNLGTIHSVSNSFRVYRNEDDEDKFFLHRKSMATKTLIRTGASLMNRLLSKSNPFLLHQNNATRHQIFPSLSKLQTSLNLSPRNDDASLPRFTSPGFLYPSGLPSLEFFLPEGILLSFLYCICLFIGL